MSSNSDVRELIRTQSLPTSDWNQYYDRIYVDEEIKEKLVNYGLLLEQFRRQGFDEMTLAYHGAVLLYGPPGTGKTTLTRGVANEVAQSVEENIEFREVRVEQLFSGTLGDTPKAVGNVFDTLIESAETGTKQIVLFDEVESLISNRDTLVGETDPMDVARAVNVALERIDELADYPNIYLISTSNLPSAVDSAFFDRADVHFRIGNPEPRHRGQILADIFSHLNETFRCKLPTNPEQMDRLIEVTDGFSGRRIRKTVLESIVGDRSTITDPSQFTVDQVERTAASARTRLLQDDADNLTETKLYESEELPTQQDAEKSKPPETGTTRRSVPEDSEDEQSEGDSAAESAQTDSSDSISGKSGSDGVQISRDLPIDEGVSGKTSRALNRAGMFASELLSATEYNNADLVENVLTDENVESALYPIVMAQGLESIRFDVGDHSFELAADYGMGNDDTIPQPLDDVTASVPSKGQVVITFQVNEKSGGIGKLDSLEVDSDRIALNVESIQSAEAK